MEKEMEQHMDTGSLQCLAGWILKIRHGPSIL